MYSFTLSIELKAIEDEVHIVKANDVDSGILDFGCNLKLKERIPGMNIPVFWILLSRQERTLKNVFKFSSWNQMIFHSLKTLVDLQKGRWFQSRVPQDFMVIFAQV